MNLSFRRLTVENFKAFFGEAQTINLHANGPGLNFLCGKNQTSKALGSNGSGKSSLLDALSWCLFGHTVSGLRNPDIKPWNTNKATFVAVEAIVDTKVNVIARTTNPNLITINDKPATQEDIEALIGLSAEVFFHTILLGQGQPLFLDLPPRDKMKVFHDVLHLEKWEERAKAASTRVRELENEQAALEGEQIGLKSSVTQLEELLERNKRVAEEWEAERKARLQELELDALSYEEAAEKAEMALGEVQLKHDSAGTEAKQLARDVEQLDDQVRTANDDLTEKQRKSQQLNVELAHLEGTLHDLQAAKTCPTCGQPIKKTNVAEHAAELDDKVAAVKAKIAKLPSTKTVVALIGELKGKLQTAIKRKRDFEDKEAEQQSKLQRLTSAATAARTSCTSTKQRLKDEEAKQNPHRDQSQTLRNKIAAATTEITTIQEQLELKSKRTERTRFWTKGFKDVCLYLIEEILHELEIVSNEMLAEVGLDEWIIQFDVERQTQSGTTQRGLDVSILGPSNQRPVKWESWSGGEGQRLRIIGALALGEVLLNHAGVHPDLEILDEPTTHLSMEGTRDLCAMLAERAKRLDKHVWYIDHMSVDSMHFSSVTTVVKTNKGATIEAN